MAKLTLVINSVNKTIIKHSFNFHSIYFLIYVKKWKMKKSFAVNHDDDDDSDDNGDNNDNGGGGVGAEFLGEFYQFLTSALMQSLIMLQARSENGYGF